MRRALPACRTCVNLAAMDRAPTRRQILRLLAGSPLLAAGSGAAFAAKTALIERLIQEAQGAAERLAADRFHFRQAARHPLPGQHADRRAEASGAIRRPRRCVRLRHVLRGGAGGGHRPRPRGVRDVAPPHPLRPRQRAIRPAQSLFRRLVQAQHRERHLPAGRDRAVGRDRQDRHLAPRVRQAPGVDRRDFQGDAAGTTPSCWRRATSSASRRGAPSLDYYHTGLVAFGKSGELLLRNASQSRGRVVEDKMAAFVTVNPVKYRDAAAGGREHAGCGAPLKKRKARAPRRKPA